jgi:hypothetical protein
MTGQRDRAGRLRRGLGNLLLVAASVALCIGIFEVVLRAWPTLLGAAFANGVRNRYTTREGGIYYRDPSLRMNFMIPGLKVPMYYNGHTWTHEADALGFRNRHVAIPADVVLLGDSFIYGQGVELEDTVGHVLEQITGRPVANLARQGDSAYQEAYLLSAHIGLFRPRHVVYFYFENDIADLFAYLKEDAMRAFIREPIESIRYPPRMDVAQALRARETRLASRPWHWSLTHRPYLVRAWNWFVWSRRAARPAPARAPVPAPVVDAVAGAAPHPGAARGREARTPAVPAPPASVASSTDVDDERSIGWQYTRKAIAYMQRLSERHGARLLIVPITPTNPRHFEILRGIAEEYHLPFLDTSALPRDAALWLPNDGHFSPAGARRVAEMVAAALRPAR